MSYIIDGHNLIPNIPGLALGTIDDENQLIALLQRFTNERRKHVELYFDKAAKGHPTQEKYARINVYFAARESTADALIKKRLHKLGKSARSWTVVSSDRSIQTEARSVGARVIESGAFARQLLEALEKNAPPEETLSELSPDEIEHWENLFKNSGDHPS